MGRGESRRPRGRRCTSAAAAAYGRPPRARGLRAVHVMRRLPAARQLDAPLPRGRRRRRDGAVRGRLGVLAGRVRLALRRRRRGAARGRPRRAAARRAARAASRARPVRPERLDAGPGVGGRPAAHQLPQRLLGHRAARAAAGGPALDDRPARRLAEDGGTRRRATLRPSRRRRARPACRRPRRRAGAARSRSAWPPTTRRRTCCARQLDSIRAQTHRRLGLRDQRRRARTPSASPRSRRAVGGDPRFVVSRSPRRLGFYRNFERALALVPAGARASSRWPTRTTRWHPDKLATLLRRARRRASSSTATPGIVDRDGAVLADTYWERAPQQPRRPPLAAGRQRGHRRGVAAPRATCSTSRCPSRPRSSPTSTTTGSALVRAGARATSPTSTARSTTTSSTARPCSATRAANQMPSLRERLRLAAPRPARADPAVADASTSSTSCRLRQFADGAAAALRRPDARGASAARCERFAARRRARWPALAGCWSAARAS